MFVLLPIVLSYLVSSLLSNAYNSAVSIGVLNLDQGEFGTYFIKDLATKPNYKVFQLDSLSELKEQIKDNKVNGAFVIPEIFSESLIQGDQTELTQYEWGQSENTFSLSTNIQLEISLFRHSMERLFKVSQDNHYITEQMKRIWSQQLNESNKAPLLDNHLNPNPELNTVVGLIIMFMMGFINKTIYIITEDRHERTLMRVYTAPIRTIEILFGHILGSFFVGSVQMCLIVFVSHFVLGLNYGVGLFSQLLVFELFLLAAIGLACMLSHSQKSSLVAMSQSFIIIPSCMLGGCFWPTNIMPDFLQKFANFVPQKWAIDAIMKLASGLTIQDIRFEMGILVLFAIVFIAFGFSVLKPADEHI
ncbi:MAG: transporter [Bacilli bacterium]|nr:transporter [Bacilli bacterium]